MKEEEKKKNLNRFPRTSHLTISWTTYFWVRTCQWLKVPIFFLVSTTIVFMLVTIAYCFLLTKYLYSSMIIWRGLNLNHLGVEVFYDIMDSVGQALSKHLNIVWIKAIMHPFILMIDFFASIEIDLGAVEVTVCMYVCMFYLDTFLCHYFCPYHYASLCKRCMYTFSVLYALLISSFTSRYIIMALSL